MTTVIAQTLWTAPWLAMWCMWILPLTHGHIRYCTGCAPVAFRVFSAIRFEDTALVWGMAALAGTVLGALPGRLRLPWLDGFEVGLAFAAGTSLLTIAARQPGARPAALALVVFVGTATARRACDALAPCGRDLTRWLIATAWTPLLLSCMLMFVHMQLVDRVPLRYAGESPLDYLLRGLDLLRYTDTVLISLAPLGLIAVRPRSLAPRL